MRASVFEHPPFLGWWGHGEGRNVAKQPAKGQKTPANASKTRLDDQKTDESSAQIADPIPPEFHPSASAKSNPETAQTPKDSAKSPAETPEATKKPDEPAAKSPQVPLAASAEKPARQAGFIPLVLGGLVAGVIGFGVATLTTPAADGPLAEQVARQGATITALEQQIAALSAEQPPTVDLSPIEDTQNTLAAEIDRLDGAIAGLGERIDNLQPASSGGDGPALDTGAIQSEMDALRSQMRQQLAEMTQAAQDQLESARAEAAMIEENAAVAAQRAAGRAALAQVQTGLETGAPLGAALDDLQQALGEPLPDALAAVRDGVPTLASLQEAFPDVARTALATARSEGVAGEETSGLGAFLRNQLDVRSVTPREGNTVDAILSRTEAAVKSGRLSDALAELAALPDVARAEMSDWLALAETRASAVTAVDMLATSLNDN